MKRVNSYLNTGLYKAILREPAYGYGTTRLTAILESTVAKLLSISMSSPRFIVP
ncbi:MAG: hypothetical protein QXY49_03410 [Thermofilaceae archaeon]